MTASVWRRILLSFVALTLIVACSGDAATEGDPVSSTAAAETTQSVDTAGDDEAPSTTASGNSDGPRAGGDLVFARTRDNSSLDPVEAVETDTIYVLDHIFETLFAASDDGSSVEPWLASDYELSDDGLIWTVTLREGVEFSNGQPLTSADVKFSIERAMEESAFGFLLSAINTIDTPNDSTVVFNNQFPWAPFLADLSVWSAGIIPADFAGMSPEEFFENPIGTGPFVFDEWVRGEYVRLAKNPNYWQEGLPYLDSVTWTQIPDENTRTLQLQSGDADIISEVPLNLVESLDAADGVVADTFAATTVYWLSFNTTVEPLDDVHVRRAIAHAVDQEAIANAVLFGYGGPACSVISPHVPFHDPDTPCLTYDLALAREELAQSSVPDGFTVEYLVGDQTPDLPIAEIVQGQLAEIGIEVVIRPIDYGQFYSTVAAFDYEIAFTGWTMDIPDPDQKIAFMFDPELGGGDSYSTGYDNPDMIELVRAAQQSLDEAERAQIYADIQALAAEESPFVPLILLDAPFGWRDDVQGLLVNPVGKRHLEDVWLDR